MMALFIATCIAAIIADFASITVGYQNWHEYFPKRCKLEKRLEILSFVLWFIAILLVVPACS